MTRKQLAVLAAVPCVIGLAWLGLRPDASRLESVPTSAADNETTHQRLRDETPRARTGDHRQAGHLTKPRYPITPSASAPPGRWKGEYSPDAIQKADSMRPGKLRDRLLQQTVLAWAAQSPDEARKWVEDRKDPAERERLLQAIKGNLNGTGSLPTEQQTVEKLGHAVERFDADESERVQIEDLTEEWARANLTAARDWVLAQPEGEIRDELLSRMALVQAKENPPEAARLVTDHIPAGPVYDEAVISVVHQWSLKDSAAAAAWMETFPAGPLKLRAQKELDGLPEYRTSGDAPASAQGADVLKR